MLVKEYISSAEFRQAPVLAMLEDCEYPMVPTGNLCLLSVICFCCEGSFAKQGVVFCYYTLCQVRNHAEQKFIS